MLQRLVTCSRHVIPTFSISQNFGVFSADFTITQFLILFCCTKYVFPFFYVLVDGSCRALSAPRACQESKKRARWHLGVARRGGPLGWRQSALQQVAPPLRRVGVCAAPGASLPAPTQLFLATPARGRVPHSLLSTPSTDEEQTGREKERQSSRQRERKPGHTVKYPFSKDATELPHHTRHTAAL